MPSVKVQKYINTGLWANYGPPKDKLSASAFFAPYSRTYCLNFHKRGMAAFYTFGYDSLEKLIDEMRHYEPDLRRWKYARGDNRLKIGASRLWIGSDKDKKNDNLRLATLRGLRASNSLAPEAAPRHGMDRKMPYWQV